MSKTTSLAFRPAMLVIAAGLSTIVTILATMSALSEPASAATLYWDRDGATPGFGAGVGTWNLANTNWSTAPAGNVATGAWVQTSDASFGGTVGNVTVDAAIQANSVRLVNTAGAYTILSTVSGTLELLSGVIATDTATASTSSQIFNVPITVTGGGNLVVQNNTPGGNSSVQLGAANSYGDLRYTSTAVNPTGRSQVALNHLSAISPTATIRMDRNGAQLGFAGTVWDGQSFPNNIILNEADSAQANFLNSIGVNGNNEIIYSGTISSNATGSNVSNLRFSLGAGGGAGALNLQNAASYNGTTTFLNANATVAGVIRNSTGADNALPATTRFIFGAGNTAASGAYDLNGRSQTITGISTVAGTTGNIGGIMNTDANIMGTLIINANATHPAYTGNIGINPLQSAYKAGGGTYTQNDNIAVVLQAGSTGTVTFSRPAGMTYSGGTTINGGTLLVTNTSGSGTGSGAVTVNGGTLAGTGSISGNVTLNGGTLAPGLSPGNLSVGGVSFTAPSVFDVEIGGLVAGSEHDHLSVSGNASLDGTLNVSLFGGFDPQNGDSFSILSSAGGVFGTFASVNAPALSGAKQWQVAYTSTSVVLNVVPEPSTFALGILGLVGVALAASRRQLEH